MSELQNLNREEYDQLKNSGMFWEFHPEATGNYEEDVIVARKKTAEKLQKRTEEVHRVWHKFSGWLARAFGKDLQGEWVRNTIKVDGKKKVFKYRSFNDYELSKRLCGYDVMVRIERYISRYCPEIRIVHCDDDVYSGSIILLIPHPSHGISVMFIPQNTGIQNRFFLYENHYRMLMEELGKMKEIYPDDDDEW